MAIVNRFSTIAPVTELTETEDINNELKKQEERRAKNYALYWDLYRGNHWLSSELDTETPTPVINKCFVFVNKSVAFMVGKAPTINYTNEEVEQILAPYVNMVLHNSGGFHKFAYEAAQMGSVTGDCFLKPVYDEVMDRVYIQVSDSADVRIRYTFRNYQNDFPSRAEIEWKFIDEANNNAISTFREVWTSAMVGYFIDDVFQPALSGANLLGYVPIVHIRNSICGKSVYGVSDLEQMEDLNKLLNSAIRRFKDDVEYHGDPVTLIFGARISQLEKGEGKLWGNLPIKARVENLTLDTDFPAQQKNIEYIDGACHEVASIPKKTTVGSDSISNTTGVALHMEHLPIIELTDRKSIFYQEGFERAISMALELLFIVELRKSAIARMSPEDQEASGYKGFFYQPNGIVDAVRKIQALYVKNPSPYIKATKWNKIEVKFSDYLPKDQLIELQIISDEMRLGLESRKGAMKRLGKDNIENIMKEVEEDLKFFERLKLAQGPPSKGISQGMRDVSETSKGAAKQAKGD